MNDDAPDGIRRDLPPVQHSIRCTCEPCCFARAAEVRRRLEERRREQRRTAMVMAEEYAGRGVVFARLGKPKPMPGTIQRIAARYGRSA
jgi:hypothetical protein